MTTSSLSLDLRVDRPVVGLRWTIPEVTTRRHLWQGALGESAALDDEAIRHIAMRYRLGPGAITCAVASARAGERDRAALGLSEVVAGVRHNIAESMGGLASRVEVTQRWDDLVLSDDTRD